MDNQLPNVRTQNLRDFTVQIRNAQNGIVGTGFVVSTDGEIVTCAHVMRTAGVDPRDAKGKQVGIYFPKASDQVTKLWYAKVVACFPQHDDDVVLLQLIDHDSAPLFVDQVAILRKGRRILRSSFPKLWLSPSPSLQRWMG